MASHFLVYMLFFIPVILAEKSDFLQCMLSKQSYRNVYSPQSPSYLNLLQYAQQNERWINDSSSKRPKFIVTPTSHDDIEETITCAKKHYLRTRVLSGGHDYEGLSYRSNTSFVLINLINLAKITINLEDETAWVEAGATLGELYYNIAQKSNVHGFPAGLYPSVGVGGHFTGGGIGTLVRKYGLAADNIIDAIFMNSQGKVFDRKSMREDLFWALRGGGAASFGIVLAWKIKLVRVPPTVTVFTITKKIDEEGIQVLNKWQHIASRLPEDLFIRVLLFNIPGNSTNRSATAVANFNSLFLGKIKKLLPLMNEKFPELGLTERDCTEMSWINSTLYFSQNKGKPLEILLEKSHKNIPSGSRFKGKSDFLSKPLPKFVYRGINERLVREGPAFVIMDPFGGKMDRIRASDLPFPHRKGNLFNVQYLFQWGVGDDEKQHLDWAREMYEFMEPYVSSSPRAAYLNYRDLDIGFNQKENTSYQEAVIWGAKYFKENFRKLANVKKAVDPNNFFADEQSIPLAA